MNTQMVIETHGDPIEAVRCFLGALWKQAGLDCMLTIADSDQAAPGKAVLIEDSRLTSEVNPFSPLMRENLARQIPRVINEQSGKHLGVLLRPCELRALVEVTKHATINLANLLIICIDCLGTWSHEDFEWRAEQGKTTDKLTGATVQFAKQGGILDYRNRMACQMCVSPGAQLADVNINLLGLPVRRYILVQARDVATAERLHLDQITSGEAESELIRQHELALEQLAERRQRRLERVVLNLAEDQPHDLEALILQLEQCGECQDCLLACPICAADFPERGADGHYPPRRMMHWLVSCAGCGMCEQACSAQRPLATIFSLIREKLDEELGYSPGVSWDASLPI
jgi:formate dehydrogenase (coenzyme F420) beta subunit